MPLRDKITPTHLLTSFVNPNGGSEKRTLALYACLSGYGDVRLWSDAPPSSAFAGFPIKTLHPFQGVFPSDGILAIIGPHTRIDAWIAHARLRRVIVVANLYPYHALFRLLEALDEHGIDSPEIVYASTALASDIGLPGVIEPSPIDLDMFRPSVRESARAFTVGRISRDQAYKHHHDDPSLYQMLAASGCKVRVLGGTALRSAIPPSLNVELLPEGTMQAHDFLQNIDCFFYRTANQLFEAYGRVLFEAMACGLPVVCGRRGGYAEHLRHGENGFLVETQEEAFDCLLAIKEDKALRERIGLAARETAEKLYNANYRQELIRFYLGATPNS